MRTRTVILPVCLSILAGLASLAVIAAGCRGLSAAGPGSGSVSGPAYPADFALAVTVFPVEPSSPARRSRRGISDGAVEGQRYLIEPGGVLRAGFGDAAATSPAPPVVRRLGSGEITELADLVRASGLIDHKGDHGDDTSSPFPSTYRPPAGRRVALVYTAWEGNRRYAAVDLDGEGAGGVARLRERLAELSFRADLAGR